MENFDKKVPDVMIVKIPKFRAVTSGLVSWDEVFGAFGQWQEAHGHLFEEIIYDSPDFLTSDDGKAEWFWKVKDEVTDADVAPYKITDFQGGLYAVAVIIDGDDESHGRVNAKIKKWLETTNFAEDYSRLSTGHMIYVDEEIKKGLGYDQMSLYIPIKLKN